MATLRLNDLERWVLLQFVLKRLDRKGSKSDVHRTAELLCALDEDAWMARIRAVQTAAQDKASAMHRALQIAAGVDATSILCELPDALLDELGTQAANRMVNALLRDEQPTTYTVQKAELEYLRLRLDELDDKKDYPTHLSGTWRRVLARIQTAWDHRDEVQVQIAVAAE